MYLPFNLEIYAEALCLDYKLKVGKLGTCMYDPRSLQLFSLAEHAAICQVSLRSVDSVAA